MLDNIKKINIDNKEITIIGTAHVSKKSADEVTKLIREINPDSICIELDEGRFSSLNNEENWKETDIINIIKQKKTSLLLINLILSSYQKRIAESFNINTGQEMINAINLSKELNKELVLADRDIKTTFLRIFRKMSLFEKSKLLVGLIFSFFDNEEMSNDELESLKDGDFIENALLEIGSNFPGLKKYLVDERDIYLSQKIKKAPGSKIVGVIGAAHLYGVLNNIDKDINLDEIEKVPKGSNIAKIIGILIPLFIIAMVALSFVKSFSTGFNQIVSWFFYNGIFSAIGTIFAFGSIPAILTSLVVAPFTSLNPLIAAGWFSGIVEAYVKKPKVRDFDDLSTDLENISGLWKNRVTRILLVVTFANLGSAIGTFVAGADIFKNLLDLF